MFKYALAAVSAPAATSNLTNLDSPREARIMSGVMPHEVLVLDVSPLDEGLDAIERADVGKLLVNLIAGPRVKG